MGGSKGKSIHDKKLTVIGYTDEPLQLSPRHFGPGVVESQVAPEYNFPSVRLCTPERRTTCENAGEFCTTTGEHVEGQCLKRKPGCGWDREAMLKTLKVKLPKDRQRAYEAERRAVHNYLEAQFLKCRCVQMSFEVKT